MHPGKMLRYNWTCSCCERQCDELPIHWTGAGPSHYEGLPAAERSSRAQLSEDFCTVDGNVFFIRGQIELPIVGMDEIFTWGAWASLSGASMARVQHVWIRLDREEEGPFFGWLNSKLPLYPSTLNLRSNVHLRPAPQIPWIQLEPTDHPLAIEQRQGIRIERVIEIAEALLPRH